MQNVTCHDNSVQSKGKVHKIKKELNDTEVNFRFTNIDTM